MDVVVSLENRFDRTPDGAVWTQAMFPHSFWQRYLDVFDRVRILARARDVPQAGEGWLRVDGECVSLVPVPHYLGPFEYARRWGRIRRAVRAAVDESTAVILRVNSPIANCLEPCLKRTGHPFGVEVVCDPYDGLAPGAIRHPLRPFLRRYLVHRLRRQCRNACGSAYVTEYALQRRYPPPATVYTTHYSSVELPRQAFRDAPRTDFNPKTYRLVSVGTLAQMYKGVDVLIDAVCICLREGLDLRAEIIGDGKHRAELEARAQSRGCGDRVSFVGQLPAGEAVRGRLDAADLFVHPSRQEGLPRAMIEAMARGLPCVGTSVGGIPELLPSEDLVAMGSPEQLAKKITEVVTDPTRMMCMSRRNLQHAARYCEDALRVRRIALYEAVRSATAAWQSRMGLSRGALSSSVGALAEAATNLQTPAARNASLLAGSRVGGQH